MVMGGLKKVLAEIGSIVEFSGRVFHQLFQPPFEGRELIRQMDETGSKSLVLVLVTGCSIGIVLSMQSRGTLARFGAEAVLPTMLALSVVKEIGPVITSLVLAGRLGAGIVAELGSMRVTEQIDALEVTALQPFKYLVITRVLACMVMFPLLTIVCDVVALLGGYFESLLSTNLDFRLFVDRAFSNLRMSDLLFSTAKTSIFGFLVAIVGCYAGYNVQGGTREVGQAAMRAVVIGSLLVLLADVMMVRLSLILFPG